MNEHIHIPVKDHLGNTKKYFRLKVDGPIYNHLMKMFGDKLPRYIEDIKFYCDDKRHLVCIPYSIDNLHLTAKMLDIGSHWFHKKENNRSHYDIPKNRIEEIMNQCIIVSSKDIIDICKGTYSIK